MRRVFATVFFMWFLLCSVAVSPASAEVDTGDMALLQGYDAFRNEDWVSALFFFRRAVSVQDAPEETWYMLILSEMFAEDYAAAVDDCDLFIVRFPSGAYYPLALYQRGRALYYLGQYDGAVAQLTEFCHLYPMHEMYASALFWIAESFFNEYNYPAAKVLYERIVSDFPRDAKSVDAQMRLRTIGQAEREEKLLYLLKVTGEEYLAAREEYERQIRQYQSEDSIGLYDQLQRKNEELEQFQDMVSELEAMNAEQERRIEALENQNRELQVAAEEARRVAADVAAAAGKSVREAQEAEAAAVAAANAAEEQKREAERKAAESTASSQAAADVQNVAPVDSSSVDGSAARGQTVNGEDYPELEELKRKAAELQRLIEQKSVGGEK